MEIIEKQVEKVKEVPADGYYGYGYGRRDINGKANAGLTLGIIGTALGAWALFGNRRSSGLLDLIADKDGNIDIENILTEMMENLMTTNPFTFKTSFVGDIEIGGGEIKFNLPLTNKRLVLNMTDLETFKEMLITKD
ncbi:hypothetical protein [Fusobacterium sp.]|uniref:hypothetical protein n=1 Tax=Fusobacterium sp. TaxID=68766 RepID=UPI002E793665|nr:hypothetical protein [Fusobacterium sp.]MEE1476282.1 hypothetical protein [Fusobacterium sp.]